MIRALAPYLFIALIISAVAAVAYSRGAPAWVADAAAGLGVLVVLPAYIRWDKRHYG